MPKNFQLGLMCSTIDLDFRLQEIEEKVLKFPIFSLTI